MKKIKTFSNKFSFASISDIKGNLNYNKNYLNEKNLIKSDSNFSYSSSNNNNMKTNNYKDTNFSKKFQFFGKLKSGNDFNKKYLFKNIILNKNFSSSNINKNENENVKDKKFENNEEESKSLKENEEENEKEQVKEGENEQEDDPKFKNSRKFRNFAGKAFSYSFYATFLLTIYQAILYKRRANNIPKNQILYIEPLYSIILNIVNTKDFVIMVKFIY
jgi:hypothetical protein